MLAVKIRRGMASVLAVSMGTTLVLLFVQGRWKDVIPLHLCSLSAVAAMILAMRPRSYLLDFLWYLGMPGAMLALIFPAPASSCAQWLMTASYVVTHGMILLIPTYMMFLGMRPSVHASGKMMFALNAAALCAAGVNGLLGTDFLFLSAPPVGTPLEAVFAAGMPVYFCVLELMMTALCLLMEHLACVIQRKNIK